MVRLLMKCISHGKYTKPRIRKHARKVATVWVAPGAVSTGCCGAGRWLECGDPGTAHAAPARGRLARPLRRLPVSCLAAAGVCQQAAGSRPTS